jgi:cytoskeletal protein RodZ
MSYILDALKKSEQERGHGNIPDVQTVHSSSLNYRNEKKAYWPYILIAAVLLNLIAIVYFIVNKEKPVEPGNVEQIVSTVIQTTAENDVIAEKIEQPVIPSPVTSNRKNTEVKKPVAETTIENTAKTTQLAESEKTTVTATNTDEQAVSDETKIIDFYDLPESIKQALPSIVVSAHIYSSNPMQRSIVINNNFLEEGEYVLDGLILYEITPDGAIFNYQGTLFRYGVVSGWQ